MQRLTGSKMGLLQYYAFLLLLWEPFAVLCTKSSVCSVSNPNSQIFSSFLRNRIVPDVVSNVPTRIVQVVYRNGATVCLGNELPVTSVIVEPRYVFWNGDPTQYYTLALVDPDALSRENPILSEIKHWLIGNIPGNNIRDGHTLATYLSPTPPPGSGFHRYVFLVYLQPYGPVKFNDNIITSTLGRTLFSIRAFANKYKFILYAGNFFQTQITPFKVF